MILEHEIPVGSKLYFGNTAKIKRKIESVASDILDKNGFEEIVTPFFSVLGKNDLPPIKSCPICRKVSLSARCF